MKMDTQQIEIIGKHILIANLLAANLEVAEPIRDHGIDLIVFRDGSDGNKFIACPIQLKTATNEAFELHEKYKKFPCLRIVFVWKAKVPADAEFFCLTYKEAEGILKTEDHAETDSWKNGKHWVTTKPSGTLKEKLEKYRVKSPDDWPGILGMAESTIIFSKAEA
jgi:hypothetical protein